jgi:serine/threonine protein kinase
MAPLMLGLLDGVAFLHEVLIAHRDIRPQNLVVNEQDWCLELIDFGEAYCATSEDDRVEGSVGVESWVAPEVYKGEHDPFGADV